MKLLTIRRIGTQTFLLVGACYCMSTLWNIPYVFTLIGAAFWFFIDYLVTNDEEEDFLFDWHMPTSSIRVSWRAVGIRALALVTLCFLAIQYPAIRALGA